MPSKHIVIIGAGIAGLTAAYRLQQAGHSVQVLESDSKVGGRMITIHWQDLAIDPGAEFVTGADKFLLEMVRQLGIEDKLINYSDQQTGFNVSVMRDGQFHVGSVLSGLDRGQPGGALEHAQASAAHAEIRSGEHLYP